MLFQNNGALGFQRHFCDFQDLADPFFILPHFQPHFAVVGGRSEGCNHHKVTFLESVVHIQWRWATLRWHKVIEYAVKSRTFFPWCYSILISSDDFYERCLLMIKRFIIFLIFFISSMHLWGASAMTSSSQPVTCQCASWGGFGQSVEVRMCKG